MMPSEDENVVTRRSWFMLCEGSANPTFDGTHTIRAMFAEPSSESDKEYVSVYLIKVRRGWKTIG